MILRLNNIVVVFNVVIFFFSFFLPGKAKISLLSSSFVVRTFLFLPLLLYQARHRRKDNTDNKRKERKKEETHAEKRTVINVPRPKGTLGFEFARNMYEIDVPVGGLFLRLCTKTLSEFSLATRAHFCFSDIAENHDPTSEHLSVIDIHVSDSATKQWNCDRLPRNILSITLQSPFPDPATNKTKKKKERKEKRIAHKTIFSIDPFLMKTFTPR